MLNFYARHLNSQKHFLTSAQEFDDLSNIDGIGETQIKSINSFFLIKQI